MNKRDLSEALRKRTGLTGKESEAVVDLFFGEMTQAMEKGSRVEIRGLCSFFVKKYDAYTGRNPKTGEKIPVKRKKLPFFKGGKELRKRVNKNPIELFNTDQESMTEKRVGKERRERHATILAPDRRKGADRRRD